MEIHYAPKPDGQPDPGEIVWAWVPYEDDPTQGKDRPVLIISRAGEALIGLMMTSKNHDRDKAQEACDGRFWLDIGAGPWDSLGRESEVRTNRLITLDPTGIRREGSILDEAHFALVAADVRRHLAQHD